jgi:hypothetical protein
MTWTKSFMLGSLVVLMVLVGTAALAQNNVDNSTPYQTFVRTENKNLNFSGSQVSAFKSVTLTCPASHSAGCTVVVQVSSQFRTRHCCRDWGNFNINVSVSGSGSQVFPNPSVKVGAMGNMMGNNLANAETFQWMKTGIPAGEQQTVAIKFSTDGFDGTAGYRTAVVHLDLN